MKAARETRSIRARILRDLSTTSPGHHARELAAAHLDSPHAALATLEVRALVIACRGVGRWHARKLLQAAKVDGTRLVGQLTDRERLELAGALRERWPHEQAAAA